MRTSEQIKTEIAERFGFFPPFFEPVQHNAELLKDLWQQTLTNYMDFRASWLCQQKLKFSLKGC